MWGEEWKLLLTTQWGADESGPKRPFPSPRRRIPSLTCCTDIRKKSRRDSAPNPQKPATCPPKSTFCTALRRRVFLLPNQVLSSRHSDGPYCTGRQKKRQPSLWATDRACLDWKDFDGAKQGGGTYTGKLVSPGKPLQLSVPAQSSPSLVPCFFLPFIGCSQGSFLSKEVWLFHESLSLLLECAFLLADLEKKCEVKKRPCMNSLCETFMSLLPKPSYPFPLQIPQSKALCTQRKTIHGSIFGSARATTRASESRKKKKNGKTWQ